MNSLEFINKEIDDLQTEIEHLKNAIRLKPVYADTFYECERAKECQARLNVLEQIKTELEAWEVVKKHLEYFPDDYWNGITEEIITMTSQIDKKDYPTIKKALEVKDEDRK